MVMYGYSRQNKYETIFSKQKDTLKIVATTTIAADLIREVGGSRVEVQSLMNPGIDPHLYQASAGDVVLLQKADIIIYHGLNLEGKMGDVFKQLRKVDKQVVELAQDIPTEKLLQGEEHGTSDPHIWFDIDLWKIAATTLAEEMAIYDSEYEHLYMDNLNRYLGELTELEEYTIANLQTIPPAQRVLITAHDAFRYFERAYNFEVRGLQGISTDAEAGTADIKDLANFISLRRIKTIFPETAVPKKTIIALQEAVQKKGFTVGIGQELHGDSLGDVVGQNNTYILAFKENIATMVSALR